MRKDQGIKCESCEEITSIETMHTDADGNWFCDECWQELAPVMKADYEKLLSRGEIESNDQTIETMNENETQDIAKEMIVHFDEVEQLSETAQEITNNASKHYLYRVKRSLIKDLPKNVRCYFLQTEKPLKWWLENNYATINELERCLD